MTFALDLSPLRSLAESYMIDRCIVRRDPERTLDDTLNASLEYEDSAGDATTIYGDTTGGPCLVGRDRRLEGRSSEGGQTVVRAGKRVRFTVGTPVIWIGDEVNMVASPDPRSNPVLVGKRFRVAEVDDRSLAASQIVYVEDWQGARAR